MKGKLGVHIKSSNFQFLQQVKSHEPERGMCIFQKHEKHTDTRANWGFCSWTFLKKKKNQKASVCWNPKLSWEIVDLDKSVHDRNFSGPTPASLHSVCWAAFMCQLFLSGTPRLHWETHRLHSGKAAGLFDALKASGNTKSYFDSELLFQAQHLRVFWEKFFFMWALVSFEYFYFYHGSSSFSKATHSQKYQSPHWPWSVLCEIMLNWTEHTSSSISVMLHTGVMEKLQN